MFSLVYAKNVSWAEMEASAAFCPPTVISGLNFGQETGGIGYLQVLDKRRNLTSLGLVHLSSHCLICKAQNLAETLPTCHLSLCPCPQSDTVGEIIISTFVFFKHWNSSSI